MIKENDQMIKTNKLKLAKNVKTIRKWYRKWQIRKNNKSKIAKMVKQTMRNDKEKQNYKTSK